MKKLFLFLLTPQGKRDVALVVAAVGAVVDFLKQTGVI